MRTLVILLSVSILGIFGQFTDKTRIPGAKGSDVVEAVVNLIKNSCIFPNDRMYLRRLAYVETQDGLNPNTYRIGYNGGIWQVDEAQFRLTQISGTLTNEKQMLKKLGIDWSSVTWADLRKPLFSGLAAAMYATIQAGAGGIPVGIEYQSVFWKNTTRPTKEVNVFYKAAQNLKTGCSQKNNLDLAFIVDASSSLSSLDFTNTTMFVRNVINKFNIGFNETRVSLIKYSTSVTEEFKLNTYDSNAAVDKAVSGVRFNGGGTKTDAAIQYAVDNIFPVADGGRLGSVKVIVLITDGRSENKLKTLQAAVNAKKSGITIFTIGVTPQVDSTELEGIASQPTCTHVELLNNFNDLDSLTAEIEQVSCTAPVVLTPSAVAYTFPCGSPLNVEVLPSLQDGSSVRVTVTEGSVTIYGSTSAKASSVLNEFQRITTFTRPMTFYIKGNNTISLAFVSNLPASCKSNFRVEVTQGVNIRPNSQALCVENDIVKNCSTTTLFQSPFLIQGPGANFLSPCDPTVGHIQIFPYPTRNDRFIFCDDKGHTFIVLCPLGDVYIASYQTCVPGQLYIATSTTRVVTQAVVTTQRPTTPIPVTISPSPSPGTVQNPCTPENIINQNMFFPYPGNEQAYIECYNLPYVASVKLCPEHHYWSQKYLTCLYRDVVILNPTPTTESYHTNAANPCNTVPGLYFYAIANEPTKYIHCDDFGDAFEKTCPEHKVWNQSVLQCVPQGLIIYDTAKPPVVG
ncbi:uncharacterized protein LOC134264402 [Saccostrea cucullata]|uniref:uncharacterized protein LOC134264402 n=1 Tax=Saccostrea cuccullata TaxID=36930 RepID=UPI002ECFD3E0